MKTCLAASIPASSRSKVSKRGASAFKKQGSEAEVYILGDNEQEFGKHLIETRSLLWQKEELLQSKSSLIHFFGEDGFVVILFPQKTNSEYGFYRDYAGSVLSLIKSQKFSVVNFHLKGLLESQEIGFFVGLDMAAYGFKKADQKDPFADLPKFTFHGAHQLNAAQTISQSINIARHLVNLAPNQMNSQKFVEFAKKVKFSKNTKFTVWDQKKLKTERMNLLLAVGSGADVPPKLLHLSYRPKAQSKKSSSKNGRKPIAFVGKGITFDSGGLDIKPSSGMRLMKKDMGGAASLLGLAYWVDQSKYSGPCDFYFSLAENAIDGRSFRPSDIITSRAGLTVEIDNTDAEGRLVLADALDVAATQTKNNEPEIIIDVATLTGAIKVALGAEVAGLFCNDEELAAELLAACHESDDPAWRMPLVHKYFSSLNSPFADFKNSADGFGGAITAALFLEKFIKGKKWAHFDIYAWADKASGSVLASGGNGQIVQALIQFLKKRA